MIIWNLDTRNKYDRVALAVAFVIFCTAYYGGWQFAEWLKTLV
jgi:hypothetical protein